jgi:hypothetical protein
MNKYNIKKKERKERTEINKERDAPAAPICKPRLHPYRMGNNWSEKQLAKRSWMWMESLGCSLSLLPSYLQLVDNVQLLLNREREKERERDEQKSSFSAFSSSSSSFLFLPALFSAVAKFL